MASNSTTLPEGTDTIIPGASYEEPDAAFGEQPETPEATAASRARAAADKIGEKTAGLRGQATDKARAFAEQGKDKATTGLDGIVKLIDDAAGTLDEKVGEQYGAYARKASEGISGLADTLRNKDVDELLNDAREAIRRNPAVAIGAAAAIGFVLSRVVKSASGEDSDRA